MIATETAIEWGSLDFFHRFETLPFTFEPLEMFWTAIVIINLKTLKTYEGALATLSVWINDRLLQLV